MTALKTLARRIYLAVRALAVRPFYVAAAPAPRREDVRSILVLRLDRIGDMVLTTPLFSALKEAYPEARLSVWASPTNAAILAGNPDVDAVRVLDDSGPDGAEVASAASRARLSFDLIVDPNFEYPLEWPARARRVDAKWRLGFDVAGRGLWYNLRVPPPAPGLSFVDATLDLCRRGLGVSPPARPPQVFVSPEEARAAHASLAASGLIGNAPLILLHPGGFYAAQRWSADSFAAVAKRLAEDGCRTALVGGPSDDALLNACRTAAPGARILRTPDLRSLIGLLSLARVVVCNNSGPLHIACALGTRTVSILGPATARSLWTPRGERHSVLEVSRLESLSVDRVVSAVQEALAHD